MVHIKKVDIFGFKSFGFKNTSVNFEPGLVSISGPNGSGKSNILDAIIFAMGENKAKVMRAPNLRSLIHDIDGNRHGPKLTRVRVQFDNSDRKIPVDSDLVTITREMSDKGESDYHLENKKINRNRLRDIFEVANADLSQLNAVQQGTVTRISEMSNEEKRKTIEDLVGLSYFDEKKAESVKQLTEADQRLEIAMAKMGEVKKQIDELEIGRNLKLRHELIGRELDRLRAVDAARKLREVKSEKILKEEKYNNDSSETEELEKSQSTLKSEISTIDAEKSAFTVKLDAFQQAKSDIEKGLSTEQEKSNNAISQIGISEKRLLQIQNRLPNIATELEKMNQDQGEVDSELEEVKSSIHKLNGEKNLIDEKIESNDSKIESVLGHQSELVAKKNVIDKKIQVLQDELHNAIITKSQTTSQKNTIENKINDNISRHKIIDNELTNLKRSSDKFSQATSDKRSREIELKISKLSEQRKKMENDLVELELILDKSSKAGHRYNEKIKLVKDVMHEDYTISQLKGDAKKLGILGFVYEVLSWNKQHERAVLATCADWIKAAIVPDFETLVSLAQVARNRKLPKLKIIPLNAIPEFRMKMPKTSGLLGVLSDYVKCDREYLPIARFLFGNIILTQTGNDAHQLSKAGYKAVSINGEFFESKTNAVTIDINSKISKLTKIISQSSTVEGLLQTITLLNNHVQKKKSNLKKIEGNQRNLMKQLQVSETERGNASHSHSTLESQIKSRTNMLDKLSQRISELRIQEKHLHPRIIQISSSVESLEQRISLVRKNYSDDQQTSIANELSFLNKKKSSLNSERSQMAKKLSEAEASISVVEDRKKLRRKALLDEQTSITEEKSELDSTITKFKTEKDASEKELEKLRDKEQELIATSGTSVSQLTEFDEKLDERRKKEKKITDEINRLAIELDGLKRDLEVIKTDESSLKKILNAFGFDELIETFDVGPSIEILEKEENSLSTSLNAIAPQKYVEISTGYRSMSDRKNELEEERNAVVSFIESIEKDKRQTFLDAFDTVDKEIREIFTKMNGGNAWLELENEDDIFNAGISYFIQFQNKPKRESTSISGGEKTLAAVVFVLALQRLKPSPFYLFDEIDAHLDAPNSQSLSKIVEERSKGSQFIMVSLKDSVVEKAKLIYGVYPKNGVSHVVTYKDKRIPDGIPA
ncbi:chromosome segregation protein SMC [Marine Group I thaumarchaeote]|uniref:Chromosome segregation protein SMC n=1 Tax=Marine Group I thaumarchaeote TaxID=2511932 RepID=A0A7K4NU03_9ARCH|nr:chromosome segregation protein SMC [Marine Group I thaumarchaeote]